MKKCICDICKEKEANHKFKVKKEGVTNYEFMTRGYIRIDVCGSCYHKLMRAKEDN